MKINDTLACAIGMMMTAHNADESGRDKDR